MRADEYQAAVIRTMNGEGGIPNWAMGLAGEAGEAVDLLKKHVYHGHPLDPLVVEKELGDVLWYVAALCVELDLSLSEVMEANVAKLRARYPDGFDPERSRSRTDG